jgi:hypothetical protein
VKTEVEIFGKDSRRSEGVMMKDVVVVVVIVFFYRFNANKMHHSRRALSSWRQSML